jgi:hypothetical protein
MPATSHLDAHCPTRAAAAACGLEIDQCRIRQAAVAFCLLGLTAMAAAQAPCGADVVGWRQPAAGAAVAEPADHRAHARQAWDRLVHTWAPGLHLGLRRSQDGRGLVLSSAGMSWGALRVDLRMSLRTLTAEGQTLTQSGGVRVSFAQTF